MIAPATAPRGSITWAETVKKARALDEIIDILTHYLPPDSGIQQKEVVSNIIGVIETKTGHRFMRRIAYYDTPGPDSA